MKTIKKLLTVILSAVLLAGFGCLTAFGAESGTDEYGDKIYEAEYIVTVYSGKEGTLGGATEKSVTVKYGDTVRINLDGSIQVNGSPVKDLDFALNSDSIYYARGLKIAGHDNDETSNMGFKTIITKVTADQSYSVAYALKGGMVKYTVNYVDSNGTALIPSEEYYGMPGDYPVVSYVYIDGYAPNAYNLGKTLTSNEDDNVFTFTYHTSTLTAVEQAAAAAAPVNAGGNGGAGAGGGDGTGDGNGNDQNITDNPTPASGADNVVNLDDGDVPTVDPDKQEPGELGRQRLMALGIGAAALLVALIALIAFLRNRGGDGDDDDADELEEMLDDPDLMDKLSKADPEKFNTNDPDKLTDAFKEVGKK